MVVYIATSYAGETATMMIITLAPQGTPPHTHTHSSRHGPQHTQHTASTRDGGAD